MPHGIPNRLQLANELLRVLYEFLHVHDPTNALRLIDFDCLKTICIQIQHALANKLSGESLLVHICLHVYAGPGLQTAGSVVCVCNCMTHADRHAYLIKLGIADSFPVACVFLHMITCCDIHILACVLCVTPSFPNFCLVTCVLLLFYIGWL